MEETAANMQAVRAICWQQHHTVTSESDRNGLALQWHALAWLKCSYQQLSTKYQQQWCQQQ